MAELNLTGQTTLTAGLPPIDSVDSPPTGDDKFFITADLAANNKPAAFVDLNIHQSECVGALGKLA